MNIIQLQDRLKDFSEEQLVQEMQMPSGNAPQYLVLSELERRKKVKDRFKAQQPQQPTVAEETVMQTARMPTGIMGMKQGGVVKYQNRGYVPSTSTLRALAMQESRMNPRAVGEAGEIGMYQIMPTTAISPGYGITSMFPDLEEAVARGEYPSYQAAYLANKDMVDQALFDPQRSEQFAKSYLDVARSRFPDDEARAIASYNVGIRGAEKLEDPSSFPYVQGVGSFAESPDETRQALDVPFIASAEASTPTSATTPVDTASMTDEERWLYLSRRPRQFLKPKEKEDLFNLQKKFGRAPDVMKPENEEMLGGINQFIEENIIDPAKKYIGDPISQFVEEEVVAPASEFLGDFVEGTGEAVADPERFMKYMTSTPDEMVQFEADRAAQQAFQDQAIAQAASAEAQQKRAERSGLMQTPEEETAQTADGAELAGAGDVSIDGTEAATGTESALEKILQLQKSQTEQAREDEQFNRYLALAQMGAALASSKSPTLLGAAGEAIQTGLPALAESRKGLREAEKEELSTQLAVEKIRQEAKTKGAFDLEDRLRVANAINDDIIALQREINDIAPSGMAPTPEIQGQVESLLNQIRTLRRDKQLLVGAYGFGEAPATTQGSGGISVADLQAERATR